MRVNFFVYARNMPRDPGGVFEWLVSELQAAEDAGQRVYIFGHMPLGRPDALWDYSEYFDQIVQRYKATIAAQFFGHTHHDQYEIAYPDYTAPSADTANSITYITTAMTPTSGNPAFRVYYVDPETWGVLDSVTYFANMSLPDYQTTGPTWAKYYSAKETYGPLVDPPLTDPAAEICQMRSPQSQYNCVDTAVNAVSKRDLDASEPVHSRSKNVNNDCHGSAVIDSTFALLDNLDELKKRTTRLGESS